MSQLLLQYHWHREGTQTFGLVIYSFNVCIFQMRL